MRKIYLLLLSLFICSISYGQYDDHRLNHAVREISNTYGDRVDIKPKSLVKFGINNDLSTTRETVWYTGGNETYATGNTIDSMSSSETADDQIVRIEGHTISGSTRTFVAFNDTLNGRTPVVLNTPLFRLTRIKNIDDTDFAGDIYGYSGGAVTNGVPQVADSIHITIPQDGTTSWNQSLKASTSLSSEDYWLITYVIVEVGISSGNARLVDFDLEIREPGGVFRRVRQFSASNSAPASPVYFDPVIIAIPGSDIRITAVSSNTGTQVKATIGGYLAKIR